MGVNLRHVWAKPRVRHPCDKRGTGRSRGAFGGHLISLHIASNGGLIIEAMESTERKGGRKGSELCGF